MNSSSRQRGFTLLELVTVIIVVSTLLSVSLYKLAPYVREAERVSVQRLIGDLRSALMMEAAQRIVQGNGGTLPSLEDSNPMDLMLEVPARYLGEIAAPNPADVPLRHWYFDKTSRRLVYRAGSGFRPPRGHSGPLLLEYAVQVAYLDRDGDGRYAPATDDLQGIRLRRTEGEKGSGSTAGSREKISRGAYSSAHAVPVIWSLSS